MSKRMLLIIDHDSFEYNQIKLFTELGFEIFSIGIYKDPELQPRPYSPVLKNIKKNKELIDHFDRLNPEGFVYGKNKLNLDKSFISKFDAIMIGWLLDPVEEYWDLFVDLDIPVIYQSLGQSCGPREVKLKEYTNRGLYIVRMSDSEKYFHNYCGHDAIIDLNIDDNYFKQFEWVGDDNSVLTVKSAFKRRLHNVEGQIYLKSIVGIPANLYGTHNEDFSANFNKGSVTRDKLKDLYVHSRVSISLPTYPCPCILSFKESMMVGLPIVCLGPSNAYPTYAEYKYIQNGVNGFYDRDPSQINKYCKMLLEDYELARNISKAGRESALRYFSTNVIVKQWKELFKEIKI